MNGIHVGIAMDDHEQREQLALWLAAVEHSCNCEPTAEGFIEGLTKTRFDLLLVDWALSEGQGSDIVSWVRQNLGWGMPVIVVKASQDDDAVRVALEAGADDCLLKPLKSTELLARIEALVRRANTARMPVLRSGAYELDIQKHELLVDGTPVTLTQKEFDLAAYLFQNPGLVMSRDHLLNKIWGIAAEIDTRTIDTHMCRLRKKLCLDGGKGWKVASIYGQGYRFDRVF